MHDEAEEPGKGGGAARTVRLPGFLVEGELRLGDVIKGVASSAGIRTCGGCARRAEAMNRWLVFRGRGRG
jgi:hypothetical protein